MLLGRSATTVLVPALFVRRKLATSCGFVPIVAEATMRANITVVNSKCHCHSANLSDICDAYTVAKYLPTNIRRL